MRATAIIGQIVMTNRIPVALDECGMASGTEGRAAFTVMHVSGINLVQAGVHGDMTRMR